MARLAWRLARAGGRVRKGAGRDAGERNDNGFVAGAMAGAGIAVGIERTALNGFKQQWLVHGWRPSQYAPATTGAVGAK